MNVPCVSGLDADAIAALFTGIAAVLTSLSVLVHALRR